MKLKKMTAVLGATALVVANLVAKKIRGKAVI